MATTRLIPLYKNVGQALGKTIKARTDYIKNPQKTEGGELVTAVGCTPSFVDAEFLLTKREYEHRTGRTQNSDIIAFQFRQAFHPNENITAQEAHTIGVEFATRLLGNEFAFIVATHTDKAHIQQLECKGTN